MGPLEQELADTMRREFQSNPFALAFFTGEISIEDTGRMDREELQERLSEMFVTSIRAHRKAILRLAREIDTLRDA